MVNALIDSKRRQEIRDAVRKGQLGRLLRKRQEEQEPDEAITHVFEKPPEPPNLPPALEDDRNISYRRRREDSHVMVLPFKDNKNFKATASLFEAIKAGDITKAADAIAQGADIHSAHKHVPAHYKGDCVILSGTVTPMQYAKEHGRQDIVDLLKRHGAEE